MCCFLSISTRAWVILAWHVPWPVWRGGQRTRCCHCRWDRGRLYAHFWHTWLLDPEYGHARTGRVSAASDVFSFGVVGLELLSSRPPYDETSDASDLLTQYKDVLEDDAALPGFVDATCWQAPEAAAALATELAACLAPRARKRPSSRDVALRLTQLCEKWGCLGANASNDEESQCVVCLDARATHAVVPCGHVAFCADDGLRMASSGQPCPMCRGKVERVMAIS